MEHNDSFVGLMLAELDADPAVAALRGAGGATPEGEFRATRGAWTAAVLRALWRTAAAFNPDAAGPAGAER